MKAGAVRRPHDTHCVGFLHAIGALAVGADVEAFALFFFRHAQTDQKVGDQE